MLVILPSGFFVHSVIDQTLKPTLCMSYFIEWVFSSLGN